MEETTKYLVTTPAYEAEKGSFVDRALVDARSPGEALMIASDVLNLAKTGYSVKKGEVAAGELSARRIDSIEEALGILGPGRVDTVPVLEARIAKLESELGKETARAESRWMRYFELAFSEHKSELVKHVTHAGWEYEELQRKVRLQRATIGFLAGIVLVLLVLIGLAIHVFRLQSDNLDLLQRERPVVEFRLSPSETNQGN